MNDSTQIEILQPGFKFLEPLQDREYRSITGFEDNMYSASSHVQPKHQQPHSDWYFAIFFIVLLIFTVVKVFFGKKLHWIYQAVSNSRTTEKLSRDINATTDLHTILLLLNFLLMGGFFLFKIKDHFKLSIWEYGGFSEFALTTGILLIYLLMYEFLLWILALFIDNFKPVRLFVFNIRSVYYAIGIVLIPVNLFLVYFYQMPVQITIYLGITILIIGQLIRILKGVQILVRNRVFLFYQLLYLCTLEILPFILFYNFYKGVINS